MQTFLPLPSFEATAHVLDARRLGKQRVETIQVVRALTRPGYGWANHPAILMWKGYEEALGRYGLTCCEVWSQTGRADTCAATIVTDLRAAGITSIRTQDELERAGALPPWLGNESLHLSHQSALVRKDRQHYGPHFPGVPDDLPYVWPVRAPHAVEAERRRIENAERRAQRAAERRRVERSRAARKGWRTRRRNTPTRSAE